MVDRQRRPSDFDPRADLFMAPALEAGVFRELCLVLSVLLNIARLPYRFFHAAVQHRPGFGACLALFSNQGPTPGPLAHPALRSLAHASTL